MVFSSSFLFYFPFFLSEPGLFTFIVSAQQGSIIQKLWVFSPAFRSLVNELSTGRGWKRLQWDTGRVISFMFPQNCESQQEKEVSFISSPRRHFSLESAPYNRWDRKWVPVRAAPGPTSALACGVSDLLNLCRASFMSVPSQMVESSNLYEHKLLLPLHSFFQPKSREGWCVRKRS